MKTNYLVILLLLLGISYRLILTSEGNFLFHIDSARDMVDVREMVELGKLRLTGPTSAIEGFYNGPAWYYLLGTAYLISDGDPYSTILMEIILWAIGGLFLMKLVARFGLLVTILTGLIWVVSNYVVLLTLYAFNPNPVTLLAPVFIYSLEKYLLTGKLLFSLSAFLLGGLFFNFEMNFGVFVIPIVLMSTLVINKRLLSQRNWWIGLVAYLLTLLPQLIFDLRHQMIMSRAVINYLTQQTPVAGVNLIGRTTQLTNQLYQVFSSTLMNSLMLTKLAIITIAAVLIVQLRIGRLTQNTLVVICLNLILVPLAGYIVAPVAVNPWHLGAAMVAGVILLGWAIHLMRQGNMLAKGVALILSGLIIWSVAVNLNNFIRERGHLSQDVSVFRNEIAAIDYVYQYSRGKNFKVYVYLPSIIDYPYQYLIWWWGRKRYGYLPEDYAYLPNQPAYISNKEKFTAPSSKLSSGLVFLIKEPDRRGERHLWENNFRDLELIDQIIVAGLQIEVRKEK